MCVFYDVTLCRLANRCDASMHGSAFIFGVMDCLTAAWREQGKPLGLHEVEVPRFQGNRHMKMARLSAEYTGRLYPQEISLTHVCLYLSRPQGHSAAGRIMSMKNCKDTIGDRNRQPSACSRCFTQMRHRVPPHRAPQSLQTYYFLG
jgi:hypothetical protein